MQPRVVYRTHYQVDEPALISMVISECVSAIQTTYDEVVAERLVRSLARTGKSLNRAAAGYAVDLCHGLSVVSPQNNLTDRGLLLKLLALENTDRQWDESLDLSLSEQMAYFAIFLEADGAMLRYLLARACTEDQLPPTGTDWNELARDAFTAIFTDYAAVTGSTAGRITIRQDLDRLKQRGFTGKSGSHKLFVHLQTLYRLNLLERKNGSTRRYIVGHVDTRKPCNFLQRVPDVMALERIVKDRTWLEVGNGTAFNPGLNRMESLPALLVDGYRRIMSLGVSLSPLSTLTDWVRIKAYLAGRIVSYEDCVTELESLQKRHLREIRFHVDRGGRPAFIKIDGRLLSAFP
jgi:hypothetical protein